MQKESGQEESLQEANRALRRRHRRGIWKRIVSILGCIVVFCTTYALILPAITVDNTSYCGIEAHEHGEECYEKVLICEEGKKESGHSHGPDCYGEEKVLLCGEEEREAAIHMHTEACRTEQRELICTLEERESSIHTHNADCYTQQRTLICGEEESTEVHTHTEACIAREQKLICTDESEGHAHTEECYETTESTVCGLEEGAAIGHVHTDECYRTETILCCTLPDGEVIPGHVHTEECYRIENTLSCGYEDGEEIPGHTHTEECYGTEQKLICETPEGADETTEAGADTNEAPDGAAAQDTVQTDTGTGTDGTPDAEGAQSSGHTHTEECYERRLICEKEEHKHELSCFSNPEADLETAAIWESSMANAELSGVWRDDLIAIAETQLGYTESSRNYTVGEDGTIKGYTRYGAWYGNEYGDWCAMFVSFCLHYAGVPEESFPPEESCEKWIETLASGEYARYRERGEYTPRRGDVIFFDWDADGRANHVGIVTEGVYDEQGAMTAIRTIEGNADNKVEYAEYAAEDERILGYGELPEEPTVEYRWSGYGLEVTARVRQSEELPENAQLVVQPLLPEENEEEYVNKFAAAQEALAAVDPTPITEFSLFRVYLEADGQEILPDKEATVEIRLNAEAPAVSLLSEGLSETAAETEGPAPEAAEETAGGSTGQEAQTPDGENPEEGTEAPTAKEPEDTESPGDSNEMKLFRYSAEGTEMRTPEADAESGSRSGSFETKLSGEYAIAEAEDIVLMDFEPRAGEAQPEPVYTPHKRIDALRDGKDNPDTTLDNRTDTDKSDLYRLYLEGELSGQQEPIDLLIVVDQSGSMQGDDGRDMTDDNGAAIQRDEAIRLVLNGTYNAGDYTEKREKGLIYRFLSANPDNNVAVVGFQGEAVSDWISGDLYAYYRQSYDKASNPDADTLQEWTKEDAYIDVKGLYYNGTNYSAGFLEAKKMLDDPSIKDNGHKKILLFMSDGEPTFYLNQSGNYRYGHGKGTYNNTRTETLNRFAELINGRDDLTVYTVKIAASSTGKELLTQMAGAQNYYEANETDDLRKAMKKMMFGAVYSELKIEDTLSQYVDLYEAQPDAKVTLKEPDGTVKILYESRTITEDGEGIISGVSYDSTTKTVRAVFDPKYTPRPGTTVTLSFNVTTNRNAYNEYARNGYQDSEGNPITGEEDTDYPGNATSTGQGGFRSNALATLSYQKDDVPGTQEYPHPVVQAVTCRAAILKTDSKDESKRLKGAEFTLYRKALTGETGESIETLEGSYIKLKEKQTTDENGQIVFDELIPGEYCLIETKAPDGYYKLTRPVTFTLTRNADGSGQIVGSDATITVGDETVSTLTVANEQWGYELPMTGGAGTQGYTTGGLLLLWASGLLLYKTRKRGKEDVLSS